MEKFNAMRTRLLQHLQKKTTWFKSIVALTCLLLTSASAFAQTKTVTGTVTDAANEPLIGASVLVQGYVRSESRRQWHNIHRHLSPNERLLRWRWHSSQIPDRKSVV